jgi:hypothetical protein
LLVTARLGIIGVPEDAGGIVARCAQLGVEPVFLVDGDKDPTLPPGCEVLQLRDRSTEALLDGARLSRLSGLWAARCEEVLRLAEAAAVLNFPHMPCMDDARQGTIPIHGAVVYPFSALEHLREEELQALPIPAWVRAACTEGDSSCMRLDHPNDLSLASAKLQKRNLGGPIRIQPALEGAVYRVLAFRTGKAVVVACVVSEETTSSVYRVPLSVVVPAEGRAGLAEEVEALASSVSAHLPEGWGYVELEIVDTTSGLRLIDVQCPARLDPRPCDLVWLALGIDLRLAAMSCALGRTPVLAATLHSAAAMMWLLTRSGVVTGLEGVEEARRMDGIVEVFINAREGDILSHVVDIPSRERGGYIVAMGDSAAQARERLDAARARVWINTSPALL